MVTVRADVDLKWSVATGSPGVNTWHISTTGSLDDDFVTGTLIALRDFYQAIRGIYPNAVTISSDGSMTQVDNPGAGSEVAGAAWSLTGTAGTGWAPPGLAVNLEKRTATPGRSGRGRTYLGPVGANVIGPDGTFLASERAVMAAAAQGLADDLAVVDASIAVWSRTDQVSRPVTNLLVRAPFAMLRSRRD